MPLSVLLLLVVVPELLVVPLSVLPVLVVVPELLVVPLWVVLLRVVVPFWVFRSTAVALLFAALSPPLSGRYIFNTLSVTPVLFSLLLLSSLWTVVLLPVAL